MSYTYEYPRPMVTVDCVVLYKEKLNWKVLLISRKNPPYKNHLALPGGFIGMDENLEVSVKREIKEETDIDMAEIKQFGVYGDIGRDPRGRVITIAYYSILNEFVKGKAGDDASDCNWYNLDQVENLAFDHDKILSDLKTTILTY